MSRSLLPLAILTATALAPMPATAQRFARPDVPRGAVSGLEMGIEGNLAAPPGGHVRWYVTVYEIVGGRELRLAAATELRALASFHRSEPVAVATTDAGGRARIEFEVPADLEQSFNLVVEARSPKRVMRSFDVRVQLGPRYRTELFTDRSSLAPGAPLQVWGRVFDLARNRPAVNHQVQLRAKRHDGALIGRAHELHSNSQGMFHALLTAPEQDSTFSVEAMAEKSSSVSRSVTATLAAVPELIVYARPQSSVVAPGTTIQVDVTVRTPDGRPVPRAALTGLSIPVAKGEDDDRAPVLTDARGRARVPWRVTSTAELADVSATIMALREGIGTGSATVGVRVARVATVVTWAVEGGALVPGLPGRIFVKAFGPDGKPRTGLAVSLDSGRLQAPPSVTDDSGVAVLEATVASVDAEPPSSCRGPTVAAATLEAGAHAQELCLPVDPDATLRVRSAPTVVAGSKLEIELLATAEVAAAPVAVTILSRGHGHGWFPVGQEIVAGKSRLFLTVPADVRGPVWIRARPLIGGARQEVRGGSAMVWSAPRHDYGVRVAPKASGAMRVELTGRSAGTDSAGFVFALPVAQGERLSAELRRAQGDWPGPSAGAAEWMGFLAARTPTDSAVSAVLRGRQVVALAMPENAVGEGLLRDPWRSRARFVRGRLGRLMLAIEERVTRSIPDKMADVAIHDRRGWRFNSEILAAVAAEIGADAVAGLDGSSLTIAALQKLAPNLTFDKVARRLTRERLLRLLVALKHFVVASQLDYEWARRGSPASWLNSLRDWQSPEGDISVEREQLFDGWGRPFQIRKARGARARFRFLEPVVGYEILSAGPDGRFGTGDDVFDPFARVLPAGSTYGEAVGEEALLARLHGVELGRATIAVLSDAFAVAAPSWASSDSAANRQSWDSPSPVKELGDALAAQAVRGSFPAAGAFRALAPGATAIELQLSPEPRRYMIVAGAYGADGLAAFAARPLRAGAPLFVDVVMPPRLRPDEPLRLPVHIIGAGIRQQFSVRAQGGGALGVTVLGTKQFTLAAGESRTIELELRATRAGAGKIHLSILGANGAVLRKFSHALRVMWDGSLRAQHAGVIVDDRARAELKPPGDARPVRSLMVVSAPRDLVRDPGFAELGREHPALLAWAYTLRGEPMPESLLAELARRRSRAGAMPVLENACAAVAWSATANEAEDDDPHPEIARALARVRAVTAPASLRERSALLVALSASASMSAQGGAGDPIAALVSELRNDGWHAPWTEKSRPTVMARLAAGLLLADRRDVPGRELFDRGRAALVKGSGGGKVLPGDEGRVLDGWIGTVALAIAAQQLGEDALVKELVRGIAPRLYLGMTGDVEAGFWLLAASVYGVFGVDGPATVEVEINGKSRRLDLTGGVATLRLPSGRARVSLRSSRPVLARLEARYVRPVKSARQAAMSAAIEGHAGFVGDTAAFEAVIENRSAETIARPVVEIMLPSTAALSAATVTRMARSGGVERIEAPDSQGLLRIYLAPLAAKAERRLPIPVRWVGAGKVSGMSVTIYDADQPWRISSTPSREVELRARPKESWQ